MTKSKVIRYINSILKCITEVAFSVCEAFSVRPPQCKEMSSEGRDCDVT